MKTKINVHSMVADEAAGALIIERYKDHMINDPVATTVFTERVVRATGDKISPTLMMAMVNILVENDEK